jgi:hypothetical protein
MKIGTVGVEFNDEANSHFSKFYEHPKKPLRIVEERRIICPLYRDADKSLARLGRKKALKHAKDASDFNDIETRAVIKFFFSLQGKAPKEIHAILIETLACFLPGWAKDLSAPLYNYGIFIRLK